MSLPVGSNTSFAGSGKTNVPLVLFVSLLVAEFFFFCPLKMRTGDNCRFNGLEENATVRRAEDKGVKVGKEANVYHITTIENNAGLECMGLHLSGSHA